MTTDTYKNLAGVVIAHDDDNVASILSDAASKIMGVPFGHKIALKPIVKGAEIYKYGVVTAHATADIEQGEHVHVHNCA